MSLSTTGPNDTRTRIENRPLFELPSWPDVETATNAGDYELLAYDPGVKDARGEEGDQGAGRASRIGFGGV